MPKFSRLRALQFRKHPCILDVMEPNVPVFGQRSGEALKKTRECAYAVVINADGLVAGTREGDHIHLPGGGVDFPETPMEAVDREIREELACKVSIGERIGQALHYFSLEDGHAAHYATFYAAEFGDSINSAPEHELVWVEPESFTHEHHTWAARKQLLSLSTRIPAIAAHQE
ncbi:MAG TPA: NUDIX domain-containing protein [Candidatus Sulfotelmatobacter sp.]|nr:NUDIX domain-containing protein [Candidatus Sulfotelmatobacter sp.]